MKLWDVLRTANSNLWRNKLRSILTILAIFIGSFTIILNSAINTGVNSFIDKQLESVGGDGYMEVAPAALMSQVTSMMGGSNEPKEYKVEENSSELSYISSETMRKIEEIPGILSVSPFRMVSVEYITSAKTEKKYKIQANYLSSDSINIDLTDGEAPNSDSGEAEITIVPGMAEVLGFNNDNEAIGKTVTLAVKNQVTGKLSDVTATVVGVQAPSMVSMGRSWINEKLNDEIYAIMTDGVPAMIADRVTFAEAEFDTAANIDDIKKALAELNLTGMTVEDQVGMIKTFFDVVLVVFSIFGGIALLAASIGIINTLFMSVQERTREIGLMKAMGLSSGKVFLSFSMEAIMLGLYGSLIGIALSMMVGYAGNALAHAEGSFLVEFPTFNLVEFTLLNCVIITAIIMFIAFLAGTLPAARAARKNPIDALRYE